MKITDFGMSREEDDGIYSVSGTMKSIPMRWTAPEAMSFGKEQESLCFIFCYYHALC